MIVLARREDAILVKKDTGHYEIRPIGKRSSTIAAGRALNLKDSQKQTFRGINTALYVFNHG